MLAGVYLISNNVNGKCYVGSPSNHAIISIDGVIYNSLKEASEIIGISYSTIQNRLKNPKFPDYYYVKFGAKPPKL